MPKDSNVLCENSNVRYVISLGISPQYVTKRVNSLQTHLKQENPKHSNFVQGPYTPTTMLIEVDNEISDTEDSFCLQMKIQKTQATNQPGTQTNILDDQFSLLSTVTSQEKLVSSGMIRHMCRCKSDANGCVLPNVQRPRSEKTHFL